MFNEVGWLLNFPTNDIPQYTINIKAGFKIVIETKMIFYVHISALAILLLINAIVQ